MTISYDEAFDAVLRQRHRDLGCDRGGRQGDLASGGTILQATGDAYHYQPQHVDQFRRALEVWGLNGGGPRLNVLDIGCGAFTVALALADAWAHNPPARLLYIGVDHNEHMVELGGALYRHQGCPWMPAGSRDCVAPGTGTELADAECLVTLNYITHQSSVSDDDLDQWAAAVVEMANAGRRVRVLCCTAWSQNSGYVSADRWPLLMQRIRLAGCTVAEKGQRFRLDLRYPVEPTGWQLQSRDFDNVWTRFATVTV